MNLKDFIKETVVEISAAINEANDLLADKGACVNPYEYRRKKAGGSKEPHRVLNEIEFDVAVTAEEGRETKSGIGIMVGSIGLGSHGKSEATASTHSRIRFTIPVLLPNPKK